MGLGLGLLVYDVLYAVAIVVFWGGALVVGREAGAAIAGVVPPWAWPVALIGGALAGLVALVVSVGVASACLPRLKPGRYPMMRGAVFYGWLFRSLLRRLVMVPGLRAVLFSSNVLRFLTLRALGAKVAFSASFSSDVDLLDPALLTVGAGAVVGARSMVSGHYIEGGRLILGRVEIGEGALVAAEVLIAPEVSIGARAKVLTRAALSRGVVVGEGATVGGDAVLDGFARVGARAQIGTRAYVGMRRRVAEGARVTAGSNDASPSAADEAAE
jgi:carbonic anhydrase/acetyltransferase-like protein (isoleucine patch superfamily)